PVQAYDDNGNIVWQADYDIYGNVRNLHGSRKFIPFRQLGQYEDEETGLYYNRFRYYAPRLGNYISQDPIRLAGNNPTLYGYVGDCNEEVDILGLMPSWMPTKRGYQRHHIIPQSLKNHPILEASGINIDGAGNMKYLPVAEGIDSNPNKAIHNGWNDVHKEYNATMKGRLDNLYGQALKEKWDTRRMQQELTELQRKTRAELNSGKIKCH
ncbi:RHS repeat-associated core domain protein, partial [Prevotella sp. ICM33]|uniref:RHS repeat-associated core domain-containing protein n=1 Tax=Prevotella sp. ICM33 TaxID=1161412 RepID=UPI00044E9312